MNRPRFLSRRAVSAPGLKLAAAGVVGVSASGWIEALAADAAGHPSRRKSCILLWMTGGPSQIDTFDPKPGHANGGPFKAIETAVPGIRISEHLPRLARQMKDIAIIRSMSTQGRRPRPGDLQPADRLPADRADPLPDAGLARGQGAGRGRRRAAELRQHRPGPGVQPGRVRAGLPRAAVRPAGRRRARRDRRAGGRRRPQPIVQGRGPRHLPPGVDTPRADARLGLLDRSGRTSSPATPGSRPVSHQDAYRRAVRLMRSAAAKAFDLDEEPAPRARRLRPEPLRPGLPAGPPAGRAGRAVRRGHALGGRRPARRSAGTRTSRTSRPSRSSARCSTRPGRP